MTEDFDINNITVVSSFRGNYNLFKNQLDDLQEKSMVLNIDGSNYLMQELEIGIFKDFKNLKILKLSGNALTELQDGLYDSLNNLEIIDLSFNLLSYISDSIFKNNFNLKTINLRNNVLSEINCRTFSSLNYLYTLDLSHNQIEKLDILCLNCSQLQKLDLSYNQIEFIDSSAFGLLPELINLSLNNNKIKKLEYDIFITTKKIEELDLSNNIIQNLHYRTFFNLSELMILNLSSNLLNNLNTCIFLTNYNLIELDISNNNINKIEDNLFTGCLNLNKLKVKTLGVYNSHAFNSLKLVTFEFFSTFEQTLNYEFFKLNSDTMTELKIVFKSGRFRTTAKINSFVNLELLHIEFLKPNDEYVQIVFTTCFSKLNKLKYLVLKNINSFRIIMSIYDKKFETVSIKHLDLTGIQNKILDDLIIKFPLLSYLNLSDSQIETIFESTMKTLVNLNQLILTNSKITSITTYLFYCNVNLRVLDFENCPIQRIDNFAFKTLKNLRLLNLKGIHLNTITEEMLHGIPATTYIQMSQQ